MYKKGTVSIRKCGFLSAVVNNALDSSWSLHFGSPSEYWVTGRIQQLAYTTNRVPLINE